MSNPITWGADVPVSMPEPRTHDPLATDLGGGYVFEQYGLAHKFTEADAEVFYQPTFAPLATPEVTN